MTFKIVLRNLLAHPLRNFLTAGAVFFAVMLLTFLQAIVSTLDAGVRSASTQRLWVQSAVSLMVDLPLSYEQKIAAVEGVEWACKWQWFGGVYKDDSNFFAQFGVDSKTFRKSYPEIIFDDEEYKNFENNRTGCIIGKNLAIQYGFEIGQTIPIIGRIFPRSDGAPWEFKVEGIYESKTPAIDQGTLYFHFDYLKEAIESGALGGDVGVGVGVYLAKVADGVDAGEVQSAINAMFENGPQRVSATTEAEFGRQFLSMLGNIPFLLRSIGGAVLVAIFFAVLNTMLTIGQERTRDIGIMKAIGFQDGMVFRLMILESLALSLIGGLLALGFAILIEPGVKLAMTQQFPGFEFSNETLLLGLGIAIGIGILAGLLPGLRIRNLPPVQALRGEG